MHLKNHFNLWLYSWKNRHKFVHLSKKICSAPQLSLVYDHVFQDKFNEGRLAVFLIFCIYVDKQVALQFFWLKVKSLFTWIKL